MEQKIAQSVYDFRKLREDGYVYVDKTAHLYPLLTRGSDSFFFISRPRRFGKSLMLSTLACLFRGERDLFKGLAIDKLDYDWAEYPVLHFSFAGIKSKTAEAFDADFKTCLEDAFAAAKAPWNPTISPGANLRRAIRSLAADSGKSVVVLIDEYDAPVSHALADIKLATAIRQDLADFYIQIKECASDIRFMMMTGVTKFAQLSVFSALNNLVDLTLDGNFASLLGYTDEELDANFAPSLQAHAKVMGLSDADYRAELRHWYNGYRFSPDCTTKVYNPVAIARTLIRKKTYFETTWSETGHASALMRYLEREDLADTDYDHLTITSKRLFDSYNLATLRPETMLYQAGYLTIKDFIPPRIYVLGVPDEDVRQDLNGILLDKALGKEADETSDDLQTVLQAGDFPGFFARLKAFYAHLPYGAKEGPVHEAAYQRALYALLSAGGLRVTAEDRQSQGRADLVAESMDRVYVFELKIHGTAAEALAQIKDKGYAKPYQVPGKTVHLIGLAFDSDSNTLTDAAEETLV